MKGEGYRVFVVAELELECVLIDGHVMILINVEQIFDILEEDELQQIVRLHILPEFFGLRLIAVKHRARD